MPLHLDILLERLKQFDEVTLLELLDITGEDILDRFKDRIVQRKDTLYGEIELMNPEDEEIEENWDQDFEDGFEKIHPFDEEDFEDIEDEE